MKSSCEEKDVLSKKRSNIMTMWEYSLFYLMFVKYLLLRKDHLKYDRQKFNLSVYRFHTVWTGRVEYNAVAFVQH